MCLMRTSLIHRITYRPNSFIETRCETRHTLWSLSEWVVLAATLAVPASFWTIGIDFWKDHASRNDFYYRPMGTSKLGLRAYIAREFALAYMINFALIGCITILCSPLSWEKWVLPWVFFLDPLMRIFRRKQIRERKFSRDDPRHLERQIWYSRDGVFVDKMLDEQGQDALGKLSNTIRRREPANAVRSGR